MAFMRFGRRTGFCAAVFCMAAASGHAAEICEPVVGQIVSIEGQVEVQRTDEQQWRLARADETLCQDDTVRVGVRSRAAIALVNDAILRLDQNTAVRLLNVVAREDERSLLSLIAGAIQSFSRRPRLLSVNTPYLNAAIEGTEFVVRVDREQSLLTVFEGRVLATNNIGEARIVGGQSVVARAGRAPEPRIVVRPRDAAQWALYYPPILAALGGRSRVIPEDLPAPLGEVLALAGRGDYAAALDRLEREPPDRRDSRFHLFFAALLLAVGRADDAAAAIDRALRQDPGSGLAYAQRAVIDVVRNRKEDALANGHRAVELSPESAAAKIALSYAQQAHFQLEAARDTLLRAVEQQPGDPLARARLAELWLSLGYRGRARDTAAEAVRIDPDIARTHAVLGFSALAEIRTGQAREAFTRAIALAPGDPLPRLGLGLAMIRAGELGDGRRQIEIAVGLDSENALIRAYLGKAYFEEKRDPLDGEQFAIAKELDPLDPTAYLYDAIRKQSENRPGEALADIQQSIANNDNRATFRSRLQLDEDRAARGASLGRIYDDLGFHRLGINEASRSLSDDPANASAHRFLADTYRGVRRREIARVSELLQAQLLQDVNINPVQPSTSEANLNIITSGGPAEPGFNEFTPLFERNRAQFNASAMGGTQETVGGEGVVSAVYGWLSLSAGAYHYETEGFRDNNEIEHDIQNAFAQVAVTPEFNLQLEARRRESHNGDIALNFDPDSFLPVKDRDLEQETARVGLRYSPTPNSDVLVSLIYNDREERTHEVEFNPLFVTDVITDVLLDEEGYQGEAQYLYRGDRFKLVAGAGISDVDGVLDTSIDFVAFPPPAVFSEDRPTEHTRGYIYTSLNYPDSVTWTVGASYDNYEQVEVEVEELNPKAGIQWRITENVQLRGVYAQTVKPALVNNRTIEPTQVAGFNQFFDDINATLSRHYGVGLDVALTDSLNIGAETSWRELEEPVLDGFGGVVYEDRDETVHGVHIYWTPVPQLALSGEFVFDRFESVTSLDVDVPLEVTTMRVPLSVRYFHQSGFFAGVGATYVDQEVTRQPVSTLVAGEDSFVVVDAWLGWRLAHRRGMISVSAQNLFDEQFNYQDDSYREFGDEPTVGPYIPERTILGRLTLNF